jgi:hypothetical protein
LSSSAGYWPSSLAVLVAITLPMAQRYETFLVGLADVPNRVTHYARKYPDGWTAEVLFLVPTEGRRASTEAALARAAARAASRVRFRVCTLEKAVSYLHGLLLPVAARCPDPTAGQFRPESSGPQRLREIEREPQRPDSAALIDGSVQEALKKQRGPQQADGKSLPIPYR